MLSERFGFASESGFEEEIRGLFRVLTQPEAAERIRNAVKKVVKEGKKTTGDLGGPCNTNEYTDALIAEL